jgi:catechol 2,3-dioxygenase-like lactoylglutathione lyase family enzyme
VRATALNHVSIPARDVDAAVRFYEDLLGMERLPSPNFGFPVRWLRLGDLQLHLFQVDSPPQHTNQHLGLEVDDFEAVYRRLKELGLFDKGGRETFLWELPSGEMQLYFRDPDGNLIEIVHRDVSTLDRSVFGSDLRSLADVHPQDEQNLRATLFLGAAVQA